MYQAILKTNPRADKPSSSYQPCSSYKAHSRSAHYFSKSFCSESRPSPSYIRLLWPRCKARTLPSHESAWPVAITEIQRNESISGEDRVAYRPGALIEVTKMLEPESKSKPWRSEWLFSDSCCHHCSFDFRDWL